EPPGRILVAGDLVDALTEFGKGIRSEARADPFVGRRKGLASIFAQVMAARGDAKMDTISVAQDGVQAQPTVPRLPLARVLVVVDARNHLPGIAAVVAPEQRRRLDTAPQVLLVGAGFERPDVGQGATVLFREGGRGFRLLETLT